MAMEIRTHQGGFVDVNGLHLYYETDGKGKPLILLHGGYGSTDTFGPVREVLCQGHQVISVDLQGHGRTADIDRPFHFESMADDIAGLIGLMGFNQVDLLGYSLGGGVALRTAIQYPEKVRKLVLVSSPYKWTDWYPEVREGMRRQKEPEAAEYMKQGPLYENYTRIAPRPQDWAKLVGKTGQLISTDYDWSGEIPKIQAQTMLVFGDADSISPVHAAEFFSLLGGGQRDANWDNSGMPRNRLAILPGISHYTIITSPALIQAVDLFLDTPG